MRVLLVMDPVIEVPPDHYGGIERVVADLGIVSHRSAMTSRFGRRPVHRSTAVSNRSAAKGSGPGGATFGTL